jgi:hypothetical protein
MCGRYHHRQLPRAPQEEILQPTPEGEVRLGRARREERTFQDG